MDKLKMHSPDLSQDNIAKIRELVDDLATQGRTMTIATSKNENTARAILDHFALAPHFTAICGASDDGSRRSNADVIAWALTQSGFARDLMVLGD